MTQPLDVEYVELRARGEDDAVRDIAAALKKIAAEIKLAAKNFERSIKGSFDDAVDESTRKLSELQPAAVKSFGKVSREARQAGDTVAADIIAGATLAKRSIDDLADDATRDLNRISRQAHEAGVALATSLTAGAAAGRLGEGISARGNFLTRALGGIGGLLRSGGSALVGALGAVSKLFVQVGEDGTKSLTKLGASIQQVTGLLGSLGSTLGSFAAANPLITLLIVMAPAIFAVVGALGQLWALLLLLPGVIGGLVAVIAPLILAFQGFGSAVSAIASGDLEKINEALKNLSPSAREVAKDIARLKGPFGDLKKLVQENFFKPLTDSFDRFGSVVLPRLGQGLGKVAGALGRFTAAIVELLGEQDILSDLSKLFSSVARSLDRIRPSAVRLIGTLFGVMEHALPFLERIGGALGRGLDKLSDFLGQSMQTGDFDRFLENAFRVTKELVDLFLALGGYLKTVFGAGAKEGESFIVQLTNIFNQLNEFFKSDDGRRALQLFYDLVPVLIVALKVLVSITVGLTTAIATLVGWIGQLKDAADGAGEKIGGFFDRVGGALSAVGDAFAALPGLIVAFIEELPGMLGDFFSGLFANLGYIAGYGIGVIVQYFIDLPGRIRGAISGLIGLVVGIFISTAVGAVQQARALVDRVVGALNALPGRARGAISNLPQRIYDVLIGIPKRAFSFGQDIVSGLVNGMKDRFNWAVGRARDFANGIVRGFKDALHIGSPSKLMADEVGRPIVQGVGVGMKDESSSLLGMINSMTRSLVSAAGSGVPGVAAAGAGGTSISFAEGAVQVSFEGAVPTEQEAFTAGQAVGQGIIQTLARRGVRTAVRTR